MNRLLKHGLFVILGCITNLLAVDPAEPSIQFTNYGSATVNELAITADIDADGRFDLMTLRTMRLQWNSGSNFLGGIPFNYSTDDQFPFPPVIADFDNDSDPDILFVRMSMLNRRATTINWNRGNRHFTNPPVVLFPQISFGSAAAGDYDNDGDLDFVLTGNTSAPNNVVGRNITRLYENVGSGSFIEVPQNFRNVEDGTVSWADYDSDGDLDLLVTGYTTNINSGVSHLYRNDQGVFVDSGVALPSLVKDSGLPVTGAWGDYDNDGDLDLLMVGSTLTPNRRGMARVYRNDGQSFSEELLPFPSVSETRGTWADLDGDGDLDVIISAGSGAPGRLLPNDGTGAFGTAVTVTNAVGNLHTAFFNSDSMPDLMTERFDFRSVALRNITPGTNTLPEAPSGLAAVGTGSSVTFSWNAARDGQQSAGLTYNLRIGTTPGGSQVLSAMANPTNGQRYLAALGNTGLRTNWTIRNFALGTYYWSVQAIDHSYAGSAFAAEQSFTISNAPPVIEMFGVTNETPNSATVAFRLNPNGSEAEYYVVFTSTNGSGTNTISVPATSGATIEQLLVSGLLPSTQYEIRLVASNEFGMNLTSARKFLTRPASPLTEIALPFAILSQPSATMAAADLDHNGHLDVLLSGLTNGTRTNIVFYNDTGVFSNTQPVQVSLVPSSAAMDFAGDFNNDGLLDLFFANQSGGVIRVRNGQTFGQPILITGAMLRQTFARDADNDGDLDVLYPSDSLAGALRLGVNIGIYRLDYPTLTGLSRVPALEWGDYDNDGDEDFLGFGSTNQSFDARYAVTHIFRNEGGYVFTNVQAGLPGTLYGAAWADYDNDRDLDVAVILSTNILNQAVGLYLNGGSNGFEKVELNIPTFESLVAVDWVDFDRDSRPDLILQQDLAGGDRLRVFLANGTNQFVEHTLNIPTNIHYETVFADFDGDQMPDILLNTTTNRTQFRPRLFRNNLLSTTTPASTPTSLVAIPGRTSVQLNWQFPTNEHENALAYSFNIRVGKTSGGSEIMSAMSDRETGARQVPQRGNAGQSGTWTIRDLPPGIYYWSVQSIDHAFNGSRFAPEVTFEIAPQDRTPRILALETSGPDRYALRIDAPTRSNVLLETSSDLLEWLPGDDVYIGSEPRTIWVNNSGESALFYRFYVIE